MDKHYILCLDEGHGPVSPVPFEYERSTALMVNPRASQSVLLDAAKARVARIVDVTKVFLDLENADFDFPREDATRLLISICAMGQEVGKLLEVAQDHPFGLESMRKSYRETVVAAEALVESLNEDAIRAVQDEGVTAIADVVFEMEGHIGAARDDFLGPKEVTP